MNRAKRREAYVRYAHADEPTTKGEETMIKNTKTIETVTLCEGEGLEAKIRVVTELEAPAEGDGVEATWDIQLPGGVTLHPDLQFVGRVRVCGEELNASWGTYEDGTRTSADYRVSSAPSHEVATQRALDAARVQLQPLVEALAKRAAAHAQITK